MAVRLLNLHEVCQVTALHRTTVYKLIREGKFPPPVKATSKASRWRTSDIVSWIESLGNM